MEQLPEWIQYLLLGIIQGLTEYLPVSSSGHLEIFSELFGVSGEQNLLFAVAVHAATVLSTIVVFWKEILDLLKGLFKFRWNEETQYLAKIALSMIPVGIVGVFFKKNVEQFFGAGLFLVGCMLLLTAILLLFSYIAKPRQKEKISFIDVLIIGISQAIAILPGLSRSGTTISTGIILGNKRESVAKFSFLMVIVPILGEALLDFAKGDFTGGGGGIGISPVALLCGFVAAFIVGVVACRWMINIVSKGKLIYFAFYCVAIGLFCITYYFLK